MLDFARYFGALPIEIHFIQQFDFFCLNRFFFVAAAAAAVVPNNLNVQKFVVIFAERENLWMCLSVCVVCNDDGHDGTEQ